jgi:hypothetical protein
MIRIGVAGLGAWGWNVARNSAECMKGPDAFVQAYDTQMAVEPDFQLIVG